MAAADPVALAPDRRTATLVSDFLDAQLSPRTRRSYAGDLALFLQWCAEHGISPLRARRPDIDRYRNWLSELVDRNGRPSPSGRARYAPSTVSRRLSAVRAFFSYATETRVLTASPAAGVRGPRVDRMPKGRGLTEAQVTALLAAAAERGATEEAVVCLLVANGLRVSEVCAARIEDLREEPGGGRSLVVRGKGGKEARVALNRRTERAVLSATQGRRAGPIALRADRRPAARSSARPQRPYTQQSVGELLVELGHQAGLLNTGSERRLDRLHPHRLRHTYVTLLLDRGVPLPAVQDAARHSSADTTRLYDRSRAEYREHPTHLLTFESGPEHVA